ncbi:dihydrolipoamide succinyltransferase [Dacryopinax primogenitus]|uniref:Dihydrolipoamide acetyltransferase component of pyruvate dehydrogenase complex n=1 Tax=Dacryopinax primogenitus (strain DJM 731) TaxID=1858805 RepID=M5G257_DACPD|nr:dihydrolipoamide succinyltransferase [Dacryopinax primogenitus]EJU02300.1 dihydrolipoamide succinyltransferase [Dacryopinax primogenitus]
MPKTPMALFAAGMRRAPPRSIRRFSLALQSSARRSSRVTRSAVTFQLAGFRTSALAQEIVKVPQMAESLTEGTLKSWTKKVGDRVEQDEEVAVIETDKIDVTVNAPKAGRIKHLLAAEEDTVEVGQDLFELEPVEGGAEAPAPAEVPEKAAAPGPEEPKPAAKEVEKAEAAPAHVPVPEAVAPKEEKPKEERPAKPAAYRGETRIKMSRMRLRISERLKQSQNAAASLTTFNEIDMSSLMDMRGKYKDLVLKEHGVKLGFMSAFAKACCLALKDFPVANASIERDEIVYHDYVDLSIAVATPKGLVTPVVRGADELGMIQIEKEIGELGKRARDGKLGLEDMAGGTFTISNGGVFGSMYGTPIINLPQSAVLGMHAIKDRPVAIQGKVEIRPIMIVALTYDHRRR